MASLPHPHLALRTGLVTGVLCLAVSLLTGCTTPGSAPSSRLARDAQALEQVRQTEQAFAKAMADRDHRTFTSFISDEAVFFSGPETLRGRKAISEAWKPFFDTAEAPFSWQPEQVEVLESGTLALSTGPVRDPQGRQVAVYNSIWRQESAGVWRIIFDKGNEYCPPPTKPVP